MECCYIGDSGISSFPRRRQFQTNLVEKNRDWVTFKYQHNVKGNNRKHNNERCVVHLFQYIGRHGEENLAMKSKSNSVTGALKGTKAKRMGHSQPLQMLVSIESAHKDAHTWLTANMQKPRSHKLLIWHACVTCHVVGTVPFDRYWPIIVSHVLQT